MSRQVKGIHKEDGNEEEFKLTNKANDDTFLTALQT
jgi:hypothetical protein